MSPMPISLRPATITDQPKITALINKVRINPRNLNWERFVIAEDDGAMVGCGQIKPHGDGTKELASIAVEPDYQGKGVGTMVMNALLEREPGELYLTCLRHNVTYYERFGFRELKFEEFPPDMKRMFRFARVVMWVLRVEGCVMRRN